MRSGDGGATDSFEALLGALAHAPDLPLTTPPRADLAPGTRVGRYLVRELLGRGAPAEAPARTPTPISPGG